GQLNSVGQLGSPYAVADYQAVNPEFGDMQDFQELVDAAHERGIAVILDWVANHTAWDNPWISNTSWYTQDAAGNIVSPPGTGWNDVADLNFDNAAMRRAMIDALSFWVTNTGIDG
ncbi:MAG TPA: alpha-amylase, partial [Bacteroidetes bacterium]|nr:alpha-amylase [Bacteroidota bacterium]